MAACVLPFRAHFLVAQTIVLVADIVFCRQVMLIVGRVGEELEPVPGSALFPYLLMYLVPVWPVQPTVVLSPSVFDPGLLSNGAPYSGTSSTGTCTSSTGTKRGRIFFGLFFNWGSWLLCVVLLRIVLLSLRLAVRGRLDSSGLAGTAGLAYLALALSLLRRRSLQRAVGVRTMLSFSRSG